MSEHVTEKPYIEIQCPWYVINIPNFVVDFLKSIDTFKNMLETLFEFDSLKWNPYQTWYEIISKSR